MKRTALLLFIIFPIAFNIAAQSPVFNYLTDIRTGGMHLSYPKGFSVDDQNNIILIGSYYQELYIGERRIRSLKSGGEDFILKLNEDGSYKQGLFYNNDTLDIRKVIPGPGDKLYATSLRSLFAFDHSLQTLWKLTSENGVFDNIYFNKGDNSLIVGGSGPAGMKLDSTHVLTEPYSYFIASYDPATGKVKWFKTHSNSNIESVEPDMDGNTYMVIRLSRYNIDIKVGKEAIQMPQKYGSVLVKFDRNGRMVWYKRFTCAEHGIQLNFKPDRVGHIYVSVRNSSNYHSYMEGIQLTDPSINYSCFFRMDSSGNNFQMLNNSQELGSMYVGAVDENNNLYINAYLRGDIYIRTTKLSGKYGGSRIVASLDKDLNLNWSYMPHLEKGDYHGSVYIDNGPAASMYFLIWPLEEYQVWGNDTLRPGLNDYYLLQYRKDGKSSLMEPKAAKIGIYPNPSQGMLYVSGLPATAGYSHLYIYNTLGQLVKEERVNSSDNRVDISDLSDGLYTIQVQGSDGKVASNKVLLRR